MFSWRWAAVAAFLATAACSPAAAPQAAAAASVQAFLESVQVDDTSGFEAAIDRPAIRADLRRQLAAVGRDRSLDVDGGPSGPALDRMINPAAFRLVDARSGAALAGAPNAAQAAALIKPIGKDQVCLHDLTPAQTCLLTFAREPAGKDAGGRPRPAAWRLVHMPADDLAIAVAPPPPETK